MTDKELRDQFATAFITSTILQANIGSCTEKTAARARREIAREAYAMADAMLAERDAENAHLDMELLGKAFADVENELNGLIVTGVNVETQREMCHTVNSVGDFYPLFSPRKTVTLTVEATV